MEDVAYHQQQNSAALHRARTNSIDLGKTKANRARLVKSHTTTFDNVNNNEAAEPGKISVTHYEVAPSRKTHRHSRSRNIDDDYTSMPYTYRLGRRYLRDPSLAYPLPVDLVEIHRQNLRTLLLMQVFGGPFCAPFAQHRPPKKVLEVACGSGLWSSSAHEYFEARGFPNVSFTGLDIAPLAPDVRKHGVDWRFVQHDLRKLPLPFEEEEFDYIFVKDTMFCAAGAGVEVNPLVSKTRSSFIPYGKSSES